MKKLILLLAIAGLMPFKFVGLPDVNAKLAQEIAVKNRTNMAQEEISVKPGVDRALAVARKQAISQVKYDLLFDIPEQQTQPVEGAINISLQLAEQQPLVIDFKNNPQSVYSVRVNGKTCTTYRFADEHIWIPADCVQKGNNQVAIEFQAGDKPLNRNADYLYTLLVPDRARTLFPCFDQPDMKAEYSLTLVVPNGWEVVSNTSAETRNTVGNRDIVKFATTEPLSTYLFSFVAGHFEKQTAKHGDREITAYYRETDPKKVAQLPTIFDQIFYALEWQDAFTGVAYPFAKYDFVILPGFQFGGMEHTGATLYNDLRMWLGETPTLQDELDRALLIAHETSHMWFGDLVTMAWFNDVWTKEVFANYFASEIVEPLYPNANHSLNRLRTFYTPAMNEDRTDGNTPIQQELPNLEYAGLVYNDVIYNKAPVMMQKLVELMGKENFREGIREYVEKYAYSNATWDDLVNILDAHTDVDLKQFCEVWVMEKGMPEISFELTDSALIVSQCDPLDRGLVWPQKFNLIVVGDDQEQTVEVELYSQSVTIPLNFTARHVLPNVDGRGYAYFAMNAADLDYMIANWSKRPEPLVRQTMAMTIYENYLRGKVAAKSLVDSFVDGMAAETDPLIAASLISYLEYIALHSDSEVNQEIQQRVNALSKADGDKSIRLQMRRMLARIMTDQQLIDEMYAEWADGNTDLWNANDLTDLAYELAIRMPERSGEILTKQRERITNPDKQREFDFVSRSCAADSTARDAFFAELLTPQGRSNEAYAKKALAYLNHFLRDEESVKYIRPALDALDDVRATGDIFFPGGWCRSLLKGHRCEAARREVTNFLDSNPDYPVLLRNKILVAAYPLYHN
jgi:aminopeptidase N